MTQHARIRHRVRSIPFGPRLGCGQTATSNDDLQMPTAKVQKPVWIDPPAQWENIDQLNYVALPAVGTSAIIISYTVPIGRNGVIQKVGNNFVGGGWTEGSGAVYWQILIDGAPPPGANSYNNILGSLGSPANPVGISGFRIFENQVLTLVVQNVSIVVAGQLAGGRLIGYQYPREFEANDIWI